MGFLQFQLLFPVFSGFWAGFWGAVLWISAVSATFFWNFSGCFAVFWGAVLGISAVSATFFWIFPAVSLGFGSCFGISAISATFLRFFRLFRCGLGAVLGISAVSATFFRIFPAFGLDWGSCFRSFMDYSYPRPACYQPMAIVHYANFLLAVDQLRQLVGQDLLGLIELASFQLSISSISSSGRKVSIRMHLRTSASSTFRQYW